MVVKKSNRGTPVDMDALVAAASQNSPSLGNMGVNAKGDRLGPNGEIVEKNEDRVRAYYKNNPKSSTSTASLKGTEPALKPDHQMEAPKPKAQPAPPPPTPDPTLVEEPAEFDAPEEVEPLGYNEIELPNGDIEMVPYYHKDDKK